MIDSTLTHDAALAEVAPETARHGETFGADHPFVIREKAREANMGRMLAHGVDDAHDRINDAAVAAWEASPTYAFLHAQLDETDAEEAELLIIEVLGNAIEHGTRFGETGAATLRLHLGAERLLIVVEQPGSGFAFETAIDVHERDGGRGQGIGRLKEDDSRVSYERITGETERFRTLVLRRLLHA